MVLDFAAPNFHLCFRWSNKLWVSDRLKWRGTHLGLKAKQHMLEKGAAYISIYFGEIDNAFYSLCLQTAVSLFILKVVNYSFKILKTSTSEMQNALCRNAISILTTVSFLPMDIPPVVLQKHLQHHAASQNWSCNLMRPCSISLLGSSCQWHDWELRKI